MITYLEYAKVYKISLFAPQGIAGKEFKTLEEAKAAVRDSKQAFEQALAKWAKMLEKPKDKKVLRRVQACKVGVRF